MRILIVTPAKRGTRLGNRITAERWSKILLALGHQVVVSEKYEGGSFDLLIGLHARRSGKSISDFSKTQPNARVVVAMTGTDLNHDLGKSKIVDESLRLADRIVLLEPRGGLKLNHALRQKSRVIWQSATPVKNPPAKLKRCFEISVIGHLRPVKDPFRSAQAVRLLPKDSRVQVVHFGQALTPEMEHRAIEETKTNERYRWLGSVSHSVAQRRLARSRLTILSSKSEGGPAVISEAIVNQVPILATRIDSVIGVLGKGYPGLFDYGDTSSLTSLIHRAETDSRFYQRLVAAIAKLKSRFDPATELKNWRLLIKEFQMD